MLRWDTTGRGDRAVPSSGWTLPADWLTCECVRPRMSFSVNVVYLHTIFPFHELVPWKGTALVPCCQGDCLTVHTFKRVV